MTDEIKEPAALPLRFDPETGNLYNSQNVALARFRHRSQGEAVALMVNQHAPLRSFLTYVCETVSRIGCEGSSDEICVYAEIPKENWCPWCLLGEQVNAAQATAK